MDSMNTRISLQMSKSQLESFESSGGVEVGVLDAPFVPL